jgi:hypothetical protein
MRETLVFVPGNTLRTIFCVTNTNWIGSGVIAIDPKIYL